MIEKEFVPYEEALALKQLGYDEPCFGYFILGQLFVTSDTVYNSLNIPVCKAPTFSQAFRWFREKYELYSFVFNFEEGFGYVTYKEGVTQTNESFDTYEEAELACLNKLIEIIKTV